MTSTKGVSPLILLTVKKKAMNAHERAAKLVDEAVKLGLDGPTEGMISDAILHAESNAFLECQIALEQVGFKDAAAVVDRYINRKHLDLQDE